MPVHLLTGAGFSRNWGGWLANEAFEYLIGYPQITSELQRRLWHGKKEGFESVLNELRLIQQRQKDEPSQSEVALFERMLEDMFNAMNLGFKQVEFDPLFDPHRIGPQPNLIRRFLAHFDAIFTLNQDCLLEMKYQTPGFVQISEIVSEICIVPASSHFAIHLARNTCRPASSSLGLSCSSWSTTDSPTSNSTGRVTGAMAIRPS